MKRIFVVFAVLGLGASPALAQRGMIDQVLSQVGRESADRETTNNINVRRQKVPEDGQILSATTKWGTCYTAQGQAYKCAMQRGTDGTAATNEIAPTAQYPYRHTRQLCRGRDGTRKPCRVYR